MQAGPGDDQAAALREFAAEVSDALVRVDHLAPPPALLPWHDDQRARHAKSRRDALALASGIEQQNAQVVGRALKAFTARALTRLRRGRARRRRSRFNKRLREQERLLARIAREQLALAGV